MRFEVLKYPYVDEEIEALITYYELISPELGQRAEDDILETLQRLEINPMHYLYLPDKRHRRIKLERFPYMFVYEVQESKVIVKVLFPLKDDPAKLGEILWT